MPESGKSGSVGAAGERSPAATRPEAVQIFFDFDERCQKAEVNIQGAYWRVLVAGLIRDNTGGF